MQSGFWENISQNKAITNEVLLIQGISYLEINDYDLAIETLSELIKNDPENKEAFFNRAVAYFEKGNFDLALTDYLASEKSKELKQEQIVSATFKDALLFSVWEGANEGARVFVPSVCQSAYGMGECLWIFAQEPINSTASFCNTCQEMGESLFDYLKSLDSKKLEAVSLELKNSYNNFNELSDEEKGKTIGHFLGRYGVDAFAGGVTLKCISTAKKLKNINRIANLEALTVSEKSREIVKVSALTHANNREVFFKDVKIHWDKQNKHVPGKHNYQEGKSVLTHTKPESLLQQHAGKGKPHRGIAAEPGYQEIIDFKELIGYSVSDITGTKTPTSWGKIHYAKDGAHIVPISPRN